jgi:hypothetical protein
MRHRITIVLSSGAIICLLASVLLVKVGLSRAAAPATCGHWQIVASPNSPSGWTALMGVAALSPKDIWAVGSTADDQGDVSPVAEQWDGTQWNLIPTPTTGSNDSDFSGIAALAANDVWAVGEVGPSYAQQTLIEQWNGSQWSIVSSPNSGSNDSLTSIAAISATDIWAVGSNSIADGETLQPLTEHWNGSQWTIVPNPDPNYMEQLSGVSAASSTDAWAVGSYTKYVESGYGERTFIEHWNGQTWTIQYSPNRTPQGGMLNGVTALASNAVWAVGTDANGNSLIEQWNGSKWSIVKSPDHPHAVSTTLTSVAAISTNDLWAVGYYMTSAGYPQPVSEHWNGSNWREASTPNVGAHPAQLDGVAAWPATRHIWAVGSYYSTQVNEQQTLIESYC